jgi:hypothetical protein
MAPWHRGLLIIVRMHLGQSECAIGQLAHPMDSCASESQIGLCSLLI